MTRLRREYEQGAWVGLPDDVQTRNRTNLARLTRRHEGHAHMEWIPDIVIMVDEKKERNCKEECYYLGIPVIGLLDSNNDPDNIELPVPGNASNARSIDLFLRKISEAIKQGLEERERTPEGDREVIQ